MTTNDTRVRDKLAATLAQYNLATYNVRAGVILRDFIVIPRTDLPKVLPLGSDPTALQVGDAICERDYDHYAEALLRLAVVEYRKANPPVDEAQVDALANILRHHDWVDGTAENARHLYLAGVRVPEVTT